MELFFASRRVGVSVTADNLLPCTIIADSLGLSFQDGIFENAVCGTDGNAAIRTQGLGLSGSSGIGQ